MEEPYRLPDKFPDDHNVDPPGWSGKGTPDQCQKIKNAILRKYKDQGVGIADGDCDECHYKVYLVLRPQRRTWYGKITQTADFHWYRQDTDDSGRNVGTWSSKGGIMPIETATDPVSDARMRGYTTDCGYLCFPNSSIRAL